MMKNNIEKFADQLRDALRIGKATSVVRPMDIIHNVLITGMGGSGIGATILQSLTRHSLSIPMIVSKGYTLPQFVNAHTLFIACSYSGNTEETLSSLQDGISKGAHTICITSGGSMAQQARKNDLNIFYMPQGTASPRAMLGYAVTALLYVLYRYALIGADFVKKTELASALLDKKESVIQQQAQQIAKKLKEKLPILYGEEHTEAIVVRFQNQLNENAKHLSHVNIFPEMNHNEIVGWVYPESLLPQLQAIYVRTHYVHERIEKRMQICRPIIEKKSNPIIDIIAEGNSLLEQYYFLIHLTDWISFFLAKENGIDPEPIKIITQLKEALKKV